MFPITGIQCSFMTRSGLLAGATAQQLYQLNVKNGVAYPDWAARGQQLVGSSSTAPFPRGCGNILYIDCAQDLSLPDGISPGMSMRSQFAVDSVTCFNPHDAALTAPRLIVIAVTEGLLKNKDGSSSVMLGGVPGHNDARVKDAKVVMRSELTRLGANGGYGGGFFDFLKKAAKTILPFVAPIAEVIAPEFAPLIEGASMAAQSALGGARRARARAGALLAGAAPKHKLERLMRR
jgi:hypothetical protein